MRVRGLPWWLSGKESTGSFRRQGFNPWVRKIPWRRKWQPTAVFLPGKSHGQRSLEGYSPWGQKELDTTSQLKQQHWESQNLNPDLLIIRNLSLGLFHSSSVPKSNYFQPQSNQMKQRRGRKHEKGKQRHSKVTSHHFKGLLERRQSWQLCLRVRQPPALKESNQPLKSNGLEFLGFEFLQHLSSLNLKAPSRHYLILLPRTQAEDGCKYHTHFIEF